MFYDWRIQGKVQALLSRFSDATDQEDVVVSRYYEYYLAICGGVGADGESSFELGEINSVIHDSD